MYSELPPYDKRVIFKERAKKNTTLHNWLREEFLPEYLGNMREPTELDQFNKGYNHNLEDACEVLLELIKMGKVFIIIGCHTFFDNYKVWIKDNGVYRRQNFKKDKFKLQLKYLDSKENRRVGIVTQIQNSGLLKQQEGVKVKIDRLYLCTKYDHYPIMIDVENNPKKMVDVLQSLGLY